MHQIHWNWTTTESKYNENNWYYLQIKQYMAKYQYSSKKEQWNWLKHIDHKWKPNTFHNY